MNNQSKTKAKAKDLSVYQKAQSHKTKKRINMPITVHQTIPCDARRSLLTHRDALQTEHKITVSFPKGLVRGSNQEMVLTGGPNAIRKAQVDIMKIMSVWREEFDAFRDRQRRRREGERRSKASMRSLPKVGGVKEKETRHSRNGFAGLFVEEVSDTISTKGSKMKVVVKMPSVVTPSSPVLTGWAAIAAKPAVEAVVAVSVDVPPPMTMAKKTRLSSQYEEEMMSIEEEDRSSGWFEWGEAAMN